nr:hypothetical protein [Tanacetum cinerariifolium]
LAEFDQHDHHRDLHHERQVHRPGGGDTERLLGRGQRIIGQRARQPGDHRIVQRHVEDVGGKLALGEAPARMALVDPF